MSYLHLLARFLTYCLHLNGFFLKANRVFLILLPLKSKKERKKTEIKIL